MKNVVFFIGSLQAGGTEAKLARNFLPLLKKRGKVNPKLLLLQERGEFLDVLPEGIEKLSLNESANLNLIRVIPRFKDAISALKADVVISCMWYPAIISYFTLKFAFTDFKHIVHDTVNMTEYVKDYFKHERFKWLKLYLIKKAYCDAEAVIVVSKGEKEDLIDNFKIPKEKIQVIYNPINRPMIIKMASENSNPKFDTPVVVTAGRLVYQKGFDILLRSFRQVRDQIKSKLLILGDGEKKEELIALTKSLNLQDDVIFLGFQYNPFRFMKKGTVFCLASRYEGIGNVNAEAMVLGLPVISTDCHSGPRETLDDGKYGILVPTEDPCALANAIIRVLSDVDLRESLSKSSLKRSQDFNIETSLKQWEDVISAI